MFALDAVIIIGMLHQNFDKELHFVTIPKYWTIYMYFE